MRIACIRIPDFAVWGFRRQDPTLAGLPLVVGGIPPERGTVRALSAEAHRAGLRPGMTLAAAQAILPGGRFLRPDDDLDRRETAELVDQMVTFTPGVEVAPADAAGGARLFWLDTRGLGHLHATEAAFARRVRAAIRSRGYPAEIGIATTKFAAEVAAREAKGGVRTVASGHERAFLAPLPIEHLPGEEALLEQLRALGVTTLGAFAALPAESVGARFGGAGLALHALARGEDPSPFVPTSGAAALEVTTDLDEPIEDLDLLTFHLKRAVDTLALRLVERGLATAALRATLVLEGHDRLGVEARFVRPTISSRLFVDCLRLAIQRERPSGRVAGFTLAASDTAPARAEQLLLFARRQAATDSAAVEAALARVRALVGPEGVVSPRPGDSHRPEEQVRWEPYAGLPAPPAIAAVSSRQRKSSSPSPSPSPSPKRPEHPEPPLFGGLPARLLSQPLLAEVEAVGHRLTYLATPLVRGRVARTSGPHVIEGEWWGDLYQREYFVVVLGDRGRYWVFRNLIDGRWYLHGVFD